MRTRWVVVALLASLVWSGASPAWADDPVPVPGGGIVQGPPPSVSGSGPATVTYSQLQFYGTVRAGGHNYIGPFSVFDISGQDYTDNGCASAMLAPECSPFLAPFIGGGRSASTNVATLYGDHTYDVIRGTCGGPGSGVGLHMFYLHCTAAIDNGPPAQFTLQSDFATESQYVRSVYELNPLPV